MQVVWARLFHLFGAGEAAHRLLPQARQALERGERLRLEAAGAVRDGTDVAVMGRMLARLAGASLTGAVNLASGDGITVADLVRRELGPAALDPAASGGTGDRLIADVTRARSAGLLPHQTDGEKQS